MALLSSIGDVDSADANYALWNLSRMVHNDAQLSAAFNAGLNNGLLQINSAFTAAWNEFIVEFGSRGPDEWDLRSPTWETHPQLLLAALDRVRLQTDAESPHERHREKAAQRDALIAKARAARPARKDSIMNGADDDGSGSMVLLELAERFAKEKPARSVIFVSHQGEEGGLLGSRWFVDNPTVPIDKIVAAHNMDMVGKGRADQVKFGGPNSVQMLGARRLSPEFGDIIDSVNASSPEPMAIDKSWDVPANPLNRFCRSDQVNYVRKNIPVVYMSLGYGPDYHMQSDEPQYIDYDHAARLGRFVHDVMTAVANRKEKPAIGGADPSYPSCNR